MTTHVPAWAEAIDEKAPFEVSDLLQTDASTVVTVDPQLEAPERQPRGQLRSVPLWQLYGIETVLHTDKWTHEAPLVEYDRQVSEQVDSPEDLSFPLLHIVTQEGITEHGQESIVRRLLTRSIEEDRRYVLVTDTAAPKTPSFTKKPGKSVVDEFSEPTVQSYEHLTTNFLETFLDSKLPVVDTRNVFLHVASTVNYRHGAPAGSVKEVFDFTHAPATSPIWETARQLLRNTSETNRDDHREEVSESLRLWLERGDVDRVAAQVVEVLQACEYDAEQLEDYRHSDPEYR